MKYMIIKLLTNIIRIIKIPIAVGMAVYGYWYFGFPQVLMSHEQSQLFVWDMTYLHDRLEMPGGWGDYLWNGVVQFFCSPMQGAFTMALLCAVLQLISMWLFHRLLRKRWRVVSVLLSLILPMLLCIKVYKPVGGTLEELEYDYLLRLGKWEEIIDKNQENKTMLATGFPSLDEKGGLQLSDLDLIGGATSMGKSTFATNVTVNVARSGVPSMIYTLEMTQEQLAARINAPFSGVPSYISLYKKLRTDQLRFFEQAKAITDSLPLFIVDSLTTYEEIKSSIRTNAIKRKVKLFVIDFLQTLGYLRNKGESEASFYERVCRELKNLAKELEICIVLVVQFNRPQDKNSDPRPDKSMIRGSGGIEQAADTILLLYRPNYYGRQHKYRKDIPDHITEVIIDKGRNIGGVGTFFADYKNEQFFEYKTQEPDNGVAQEPVQQGLPF